MTTADLGYPILLTIMIFWCLLALGGVTTTILDGKLSTYIKHFIQKEPKHRAHE